MGPQTTVTSERTGSLNQLWSWMKAIIKTLSKKKWKQQHPDYNQSDSLHKQNRPEQVILFRLRTGHNRLNAHMYKFKVGESEMCPCNTDIMTAEHLLHTVNYMMLWGGTHGQNRHYWGTSSSWGQQASPSSVRRRRRMKVRSIKLVYYSSSLAN